MTIGAAIGIAALGAILRFAVQDNISGIELGVVGTILIVAGVLGLIATLAMNMFERDRFRGPPPDERDRVYERERIRDDRY